MPLTDVDLQIVLPLAFKMTHRTLEQLGLSTIKRMMYAESVLVFVSLLAHGTFIFVT